MADRVVYLYDDKGERRDKFPTKPAKDGGAKTYVIKAMAFSPDSTRIAVAQSDEIVFIYQLGAEWGEAKKIVGKFHQQSSITCCCWPTEQPYELVFGLLDGQVKVGNVKRNKVSPVYTTESCVVAVCAGGDGHSFAAGHLDGSIYLFTFEHDSVGASNMKIQHPSVPAVLAWGNHIMVGGTDQRITFYDNNGAVQQNLDYSRDSSERAFCTAAASPSGTTIVVGSYDRLRLLNYAVRRGQWEESAVKDVSGLYTVSALTWNADGTRLAVGSLVGEVDLFDACLRRMRYKGEFEFNYVSPSQVLVSRLAGVDGQAPILLKSFVGAEIEKINVFKSRFLVAHTPSTLLLADLNTYKLSEIPWSGGGNERCFFDQPQVCMVFNAGELTLVEYGKNEVLGTCRTEYMSPHLISIRVHTMPNGKMLKKIAYLVDAKTLRVEDLVTGALVVTLPHDDRIDWLELNRHGTCLLYRDKRHHLNLVNVDQSQESCGQRVTLLSYCSYVQWVPDSDVIVAQNKGTLCVWYSVNAPERVSTFPIKGDVDTIVREHGKTEVVVDEGTRVKQYQLDEGLIEFGASIEDRNYARAISTLETLPQTPETLAMWQTLSGLALEDGKLPMAERCYAALNDVARSRFLRTIITLSEQHGEGMEYYEVRARMCVLRGQLREAESIYLRYGGAEGVGQAMQMWQQLGKFGDAVRVASENNIPDLAQWKQQYFRHLNDTNQFGKAGDWMVEEGDFPRAIQLYLRGGLPAKAAALVSSRGLQLGQEPLEKIGAALFQAGMFAKAGEFFEQLGMTKPAFDAYRKGHAYRRVVDLARTAYPDRVMQLEEEWGEWLMERKQVEAAINHFVEAKKIERAVQAAIQARQYQKAMHYVAALDPHVVAPYCHQLAKHFENRGDYVQAEELFRQAGSMNLAIEMYARAGRFEDVQRLAPMLPKAALTKLYMEQAEKLEQMGKFREAERLFVDSDVPDRAINMYSKAGLHDDMVRLVEHHRPEYLHDTLVRLAEEAEAAGKFKEAEKFYLMQRDPAGKPAPDWKSAINMYRQANMWEEAYRVSQTHAPEVSNQVAYFWVRTGNINSAVVSRLNLAVPAVQYALEAGEWEFAFEIAEQNKMRYPSLLAQAHLKHAFMLEDAERLPEAEAEFLVAQRPREAVMMYAHLQDWANATRVAREHDPAAMTEIYLLQANFAAERQEFTTAEALFVKVERPEGAINMYRAHNQWGDVLRLVKVHMPDKLGQYQAEFERYNAGGRKSSKDALVQQAKMWEDQGEYSRAIDTYLKLVPESEADRDAVEDLWERNLLTLTMRYVPKRLPEVVDTVAKNLERWDRAEAAADIYCGADMPQEALDVLIRAGKFDIALEMAKRKAPSFVQYVNNARIQKYTEKGDVKKLRELGEFPKLIQVLWESGNYEECLKECSSLNPNVLNKMLTRRVEMLVQEENYVHAIALYARYAPAPVRENFELYRRVAMKVLVDQSDAALADLRKVMMGLVRALHESPLREDESVGEFERLLLVAHLLVMKEKYAREPDLKIQYAKTCTSLLRYCSIIPADRVFYEAGKACLGVGWSGQAFVIWNRFVDVCEAMKEGVINAHIDFQKTDVPADVLLPHPDRIFCTPAQFEEAKDWVLEQGLDRAQDEDPHLRTRSCRQCGKSIFEGSLWCYGCKSESRACIVTGYPLESGSTTACRACSMPALTEDWNASIRVYRTCPWCSNEQNVAFR